MPAKLPKRLKMKCGRPSLFAALDVSRKQEKTANKRVNQMCWQIKAKVFVLIFSGFEYLRNQVENLQSENSTLAKLEFFAIEFDVFST